MEDEDDGPVPDAEAGVHEHHGDEGEEADCLPGGGGEAGHQPGVGRQRGRAREHQAARTQVHRPPPHLARAVSVILELETKVIQTNIYHTTPRFK